MIRVICCKPHACTGFILLFAPVMFAVGEYTHVVVDNATYERYRDDPASLMRDRDHHAYVLWGLATTPPAGYTPAIMTKKVFDEWRTLPNVHFLFEMAPVVAVSPQPEPSRKRPADDDDADSKPIVPTKKQDARKRRRAIVANAAAIPVSQELSQLPIVPCLRLADASGHVRRQSYHSLDDSVSKARRREVQRLNPRACAVIIEENDLRRAVVERVSSAYTLDERRRILQANPFHMMQRPVIAVNRAVKDAQKETK